MIFHSLHKNCTEVLVLRENWGSMLIGSMTPKRFHGTFFGSMTHGGTQKKSQIWHHDMIKLVNKNGPNTHPNTRHNIHIIHFVSHTNPTSATSIVQHHAKPIWLLLTRRYHWWQHGLRTYLRLGFWWPLIHFLWLWASLRNLISLQPKMTHHLQP